LVHGASLPPGARGAQRIWLEGRRSSALLPANMLAQD
jgi:hypothetical protein